jgi:WD40 repeat protein
LVRSFTRDNWAVRAIFTADGETIFTSDHDGMVRSYDAASGQLLTSFRASPDWLTDIRLSPDGRYLLTGGGEPAARLWDLQTGVAVAEYTGHTEQLRELAFSPDGRLSSGKDGGFTL